MKAIMFNKPLSVSLVVFRHHVIKEVLNSSLLTKTLSKDLRKVLKTKENKKGTDSILWSYRGQIW